MSEKHENSRAETARQRRAERVRAELEQTGRRAAKPVMPVTERVTQSYVVPKPRRTAKKNGRRFNVAFGVSDIQLHRRGIQVPRLQASWRMTSALIAVLLGVVIYFVLTLPYFHVSTATVLGNNRLTSEEINAVLGVTGQSIFTVRPDEVAARLRMNYPDLALVQVKVYLPNHVYVTVSERMPVIFWQQDNGYTWIDAEGVAFRPSGIVEGLVPVIGLTTPPAGAVPEEGSLLPQPYMQKELVKAILVLAPNVPADSTMIFDPASGLGWTDSRGWKVFFGTGMQDMPLKIRVYQSLVASLVERGITPEFISVAYADAPYYRASKTQSSDATVDSGQ
jgi:cell division septal protein FtsQ